MSEAFQVLKAIELVLEMQSKNTELIIKAIQKSTEINLNVMKGLAEAMKNE